MIASNLRNDNVLHLPIMAKGKPFNAPNRIHELRKERRVTLDQIATALGTASSVISRLERGDRDLSHDWLIRIAGVLGVRPADLLLTEHGGLDPRERDVVDTLREVPAPNRAAIHAVAESLQPFRGAPEVHDLTDRLAPPPKKTA